MSSDFGNDCLAALLGWYQSSCLENGLGQSTPTELADWLWLVDGFQEELVRHQFRRGAPPTEEPNSTTSHPRELKTKPKRQAETESMLEPVSEDKTSISGTAIVADYPNLSEDPTARLLSPTALPDQRDIDESLGAYSDWLEEAGEMPLRLNNPPFFSSALALLHPLRPFLRTQGMSRRAFLDEERSAELSADLGVACPVFRQREHPSLNVRIVLDGGVSMAVWEPFARELQQVLASSQALAQVRLETLSADQIKDAATCERRINIFSEEKTITMLISDTSGQHWWQRTIQPWLQAVTRHQPMVIVHILPLRYREDVISQLGTAVTLRNWHSLAPNTSYHFTIVQDDDPWAEEKSPIAFAPPAGAVIPVISLDPSEAAPWAEMVMGNGLCPCQGVVFADPTQWLQKTDSSANAMEADDQLDDPRPEDLLREFHRLASPAARALMDWMAGSPAPLTLTLLRLLQGALRQPGNSIQPMAEVLGSGLLQRLPGQADVRPEHLQFEILPKVREVLLKKLDPSIHQTVIHLVTQALERHWNRVVVSPSFDALLMDPSVPIPPEAAGLLHVANVTAQMLNQLPDEHFHTLAQNLREGGQKQIQEMWPSDEFQFEGAKYLEPFPENVERYSWITESDSAEKAEGHTVVMDSPQSEAETYCIAKVLVVGDSGSGKTGLVRRLSTGSWQPSEATTVGAWCTHWPLPQPTAAAGDPQREVWLWDFGGQADQRLIQQLFLDRAALVLLLFDASRDEVLEGLHDWQTALRRTLVIPPPQLLVAARVDAGFGASRRRLQRFAEEQGLPFLETSARDGTGCSQLQEAIQAAIAWDQLPRRTSPRLFQWIREEILRLR
ncbi:MAG: SAV_2336 N-terminal domain-related protein, partial [Cyanobacteriota bacterium]